ncbi:hypothetical protein [Paenibacillus sp. IHBB 10380]|uniref:hypothetical protein n=1 Tax=Paenibacillus sp. IHBB 10380 TaxID=1566358 RepID=UPI000A417AED|nr:hypothetical protein [Paenibacillus sp. IHBB 10380]
MATIISFPIWSEFVGVMISDGTRVEEKIAMSIALLFISLQSLVLSPPLKQC